MDLLDLVSHVYSGGAKNLLCLPVAVFEMMAISTCTGKAGEQITFCGAAGLLFS